MVQRFDGRANKKCAKQAHDRGDVLTVDGDATARDVVKTLDQFDERGLPGTGVADQPDPLPVADV